MLKQVIERKKVNEKSARSTHSEKIALRHISLPTCFSTPRSPAPSSDIAIHIDSLSNRNNSYQCPLVPSLYTPPNKNKAFSELNSLEDSIKLEKGKTFRDRHNSHEVHIPTLREYLVIKEEAAAIDAGENPLEVLQIQSATKIQKVYRGWKCVKELEREEERRLESLNIMINEIKYSTYHSTPLMKYKLSFKRLMLKQKNKSLKKIKKVLNEKKNEVIYRKALKFLFRLCDGCQKQYLTRNEFRILVKDILNEPISDSQLLLDYEMVDPTNKNRILFNSFVQWYNENRINEYDCSGYFSKVFRSIKQKCGFCSDEVIKLIYQHLIEYNLILLHTKRYVQANPPYFQCKYCSRPGKSLRVVLNHMKKCKCHNNKKTA